MPNLSKKRVFHDPKPTVTFPNGIGPPRKTVTAVRIGDDGRQEFQFSYYSTWVNASAIKSNGNDAELEIAKALSPKVNLNTIMTEDIIDFDTYVMEQQGVRARSKEIIAAMDAMEAIGIGENNFEELWKLGMELDENNARKDIPSKDWRTFQQKYVPEELRTPVAIGAPAIEANLPY